MNLARRKNMLVVALTGLAVVLFFGFGVDGARASFNPQINYQGKLTDNNNVAVADGSYSMAFKLYDAVSGGSLKWQEYVGVTTTNGLFSVMLGASSTLNLVDFNQVLYLEVTIEAETLSPRKILGAVPAAFMARSLDGKTETAFGTLAEDETVTGRWDFQATTTFADASFSGNVATAGNLYVVGNSRFDGNVGIGTSTPNQKLTVVGNISNLTTPSTTLSQISTVGTGVTPTGVFVAGRYSYTVGRGDDIFSIIDISNPNVPVVISTTTIPDELTALYVVGRYAYIVGLNDKLSIVDISNPKSPVLVSTVSVGLDPYDIYVSGRYVYTANYAASTVTVIDVATPAAPKVIKTIACGAGPYSIFVLGRYAYTANYDAGTVSVIDISDPLTASVVGTAAVAAGVGYINVSGRYAYTANYDSDNMSVVDVSNPTAPVQVATVSVGDGPVGLYLSGRYAYVTNSGSNSLSVVDVANPLLPVHIKTVAVGSVPWMVMVSGRYAYVTNFQSATMSIVDISGAEVSSLLAHSAQVGSLQALNGVVAKGNIEAGMSLFVGAGGILSNGSLAISTTNTSYFAGNVGIGTSTPAFPLTVSGGAYITGTVTTTGNLYVIGNSYLGTVASGTWSGTIISNAYGGTGQNSSGWNGFVKVTGGTWATSSVSLTADVSGILPVARGGTNTTTLGAAGSVAYSDASSYRFTAAGTTGQLLQSAGSGVPTWVNTSSLGISAAAAGASGQIQFNNGSNAMAASANLYWDNSNSRLGINTTTPDQAVTVVGNISNLADANSPIQLSANSPYIGDQMTDIYVSGRYAYAIGRSSNVFATMDILNPSAPTIVATTSLGVSCILPQGMYVAGNYAYVSFSCVSRMGVVDISNPKAPVLISTLNLGSNTRAVFVAGHYAYLAGSSADVLIVVDIADPYNPQLVASAASGDEPYDIYVQGQYAYLVNDLDASMSIINISNPIAPTLVATTSVGLTPQGIYVQGRYAYVANYVGGSISVIDVANPSSPTTVTTFPITGSPLAIDGGGRYIYVTTYGNDGVAVVDVSSPASPRLVKAVSLGGTGAGDGPNSIFVSGRYLYTTNYNSNNISVVDISGTEVSSLMAHSVEMGRLEVRDAIITQGSISGSALHIGKGGLMSNGSISVSATSTPSYFGGRVGIGTSSPAYTLSVSGTAYISGNTGIAGAASIGGVLSVTGTSTFSGRVGINTSSPSYLLSVAGDINTTGAYRINGTDYGQYFINSAGTSGQLWQSAGSGRGGWVNTSSLGLAMTAGSTGQIQFNSGGVLAASANLYWDNTNARLAIGTSSPQSIFHIEKILNTSSTPDGVIIAPTYRLSGSGATDASMLSIQPTVLNYVSGNDINNLYGIRVKRATGDAVQVGTEYGLYIDAAGSVAISSYGIYQAGTTEGNYFGGKVGIGTTTMTYKLTVAGDINTTGTYRINNTDYGQYFINSAGTSGQLWQSAGSGRGGWVNAAAIAIAAGTSGQIQFNNGSSALAANSNLYWDNTNSRLAIGTSSPQAIMVIAKDLQTSSTPDGLVLAPTYKLNGSAATDVSILSIQPTVLNYLSGYDITNLYGIRVKRATGSTAQVVTEYGLYIDAAGVAASSYYGIYQAGTENNYFGGKVGIGTTTPGSALTVGNGTTQADLAIPKGGLCVDDDGVCPAMTAGTIYANSGTIEAADLAEKYRTLDTLEAGDLVAADTVNAEYVKKTASEYQTDIIGVVSTNPGLTLGADDTGNTVPVALAGRVPVKVSTANGEIKIGDKLTASNNAGVAMKATAEGPTLGIALQNYSGIGVGKISVFVDLGYNNLLARVITPDVDTGNVGIGTTTPAYKLDVIGSFHVSSSQVFVEGLASGDGTALYLTEDNQVVKYSSSRRYKDDITDYDIDLSKLAQLMPHWFKWNEKTAMPGRQDFGLIAEEVYEIFPELVKKNKQGVIESVDYAKLSVILLKAVQAQEEKIAEMSLRIAGAGDATSTQSALLQLAADGAIEIMSGLTVRGHITVDRDTAGTARIIAGQTSTTVQFSAPYANLPVVNVTLLTPTKLDWFIVTNTVSSSFSIQIASPAPQDIEFNWMALAVKRDEGMFVPVEPSLSTGEGAVEYDIIPSITPESATITTTTGDGASEPVAPAESVAPPEEATAPAEIIIPESETTLTETVSAEPSVPEESPAPVLATTPPAEPPLPPEPAPAPEAPPSTS